MIVHRADDDLLEVTADYGQVEVCSYHNLDKVERESVSRSVLLADIE
jgi:hypothetical protein